MRFSKHNLAIICLIIANLIWGAGSPIFKWSLENVQPFTLAFLRFFIGALILLPFTLHKLHIKKADWVKLTLLSLSGITFNIAFFFLGLQRTTSINAPIIASSAPVFILLCSIIFLKEKPGKKVIYGTVISLFGVVAIILQPLIERGLDASIFGNLLLILSMFSGVGHTILLKNIANRYTALTLTFWSFVIGSLGFLPMLIPEIQDHGFLTGVNMQGLIGILFGAILSSALAYYLYSLALKYMIASEVGIFVYMDPVIAVIIAIPLLGEKLTPIFLLGSFFVFLGIFISEGRLHYHPFHKLRA
jgi:drug/metabolite transporter (DMT)-like permease